MANTWGSQTWGFNQWNDLGNSSPSVTGISISATLGDETTVGEINSGWGRLTWGENGWGILGDVELTGQQLTSTLNSVTVDAQINIGWGSDTWGTETWGQSGLIVPLTGIQATANLGTPSLSITGNTSVTGIAMSASLGSVEAFASFVAEPTGLPMTMTLSYDPEIVVPTGIQATANLGTAVGDANTIAEISTSIASYWGSSTWGFGKWGNQPVETLAMTSDEGTVDPGPDAMVTGIGFSAALGLGTVTAGADVDSVTGIAMTAALGQETIDLNTPVDVTGIAMTATLSEENVVGNANVTPTGIALTMSLNSANALIWNEVNTGSAPIDPPGWVEVPTRAA